MENKKRIVVIGGGFAGLNIIKKIDRKKFDVTLLDANNFHSFPPLFYQVASSGLEAASVCFPLRKETSRKGNLNYAMGKLLKIHPDEHYIKTTFGQIKYDYLVIATGTVTNFFGNNSLTEFVYTLKSTVDAIMLHNRILERLEYATRPINKDKTKNILTFIIVGGGATGVEVAGALGEMRKFILEHEYPEIDLNDVKVILVDGSNRILSAMNEKSSAKALSYLKQLDVEVLLNKRVQEYDGRVVRFTDGDSINSDTVIWCAGVTGEKIDGIPDELCVGGRILTDQYSAVKGLEDIFAIGDISLMISDDYPRGHPQVAQSAIQQAKRLAENLNNNKNWKPFKYKDMGSMATIGRNRAVVDVMGINLSGRVAWMIWMFIHIISMLGMKNRIVIFVNWIWNYFSYSSSLRVLIRVQKVCKRE